MGDQNDERSISVRVVADLRWVLLALELIQRLEEIPEGLSIGRVEVNNFAATGTSHSIVLLKPSESLLELVAATGTREGVGSVSG